MPEIKNSSSKKCSFTGLLFLGGGNFSLRRDPLSAACLLLSFCPRYPARTVDHQYHLQPLRHLYVLAAEPRALHTIDVDSGRTVSVDVEVERVDGSISRMKAPGLLPELATIRRISVAAQSSNEARAKQFSPSTESDAAMETENEQEGEPNDMSNTEAANTAVTPPIVAYYPTSIELQNVSSGTTTDSARNTPAQRGRGATHEQIHVPPFFVKQIPQPIYRLNSEAKSSEGNISTLQKLSLDITPCSFKSFGSVQKDRRLDQGISQGEPALSASKNDRLIKMLSFLHNGQSNEVPGTTGESVLQCASFASIVTTTLMS